MTIEVGINTYVTVSAADAYFSSRFGINNWSSIDDPQKESILTMAAILVDAYSNDWAGYPTDQDQSQQFPRNGDLVAPEKIALAQLEIANSIMEQNGVGIPGTAPLKKMQVDVITLEWNTNESIESNYYNVLAISYLEPFTTNSAGNGHVLVRY